MNAAVVVLVVNIALASLFAGGYAIIALSNRTQRAALGFCATYLICMISPTCDFLMPLIGHVAVLEWIGYSTLLVAMLSMSAALSVFYRWPVPWRSIAAILIGGVVLRWLIWDMPRDTIWFGMGYQLPYALASLLAVRTVLMTGAGQPLPRLVGAIFALIAAHFMAKPFLAVSLGPGRTLEDYTNTSYALLSQASTGILMVAAGLVLLLMIANRAIAASQSASEIDPLSGLANRRGFDRRAGAVMARAERRGLPVSAALFDLDHFKRINDTHGHAAGDHAIATFAALLRDAAPASAIVARLGGEEFAMLIEDADLQEALSHAEAIRRRAARAVIGDGLSTTVSGGIGQWDGRESLADLIRRIDGASYQAKRDGRDRICTANDVAVAGPPALRIVT